MGAPFAPPPGVLSDLRRLVAVAAAACALAGAFGVPLVLRLLAFAAPLPPVNLTATVQGTTVTLTWQSGGGPAGTYWLEAGSAAGLANLGRWPTVTPAMTATGVPDGRYFVRVRASNADGTSGPSNEVVVRVGCIEPTAPTGLAASVSGTLVLLSWTPVPGASAYVLEAGSAPGLADLAVIPTAAPSLVGAAPPATYHLRVRAVGPCGTSAPSTEIVVVVGGGGASTLPIYGVVDPAILGTCSSATHDRHTADGGDGFRYRTWHPQADPTGCVYAHEHGDDPASSTNATVASSPVRFGYIGRRMDHHEVHEGFKVFVANRGERNDEGRTSLVDSRVVIHMGTGGARRFTMPHHSLEMRVVGPNGVFALVQGMADSTSLESFCAQPRTGGKTVMMLDPRCPAGSLYEIWSNTLTVNFRGQEVFRGGASTAVFDPITAFDPANPTRLLYMWDPAMQVINVHRDDWSTVRGCDREAYHVQGLLYNGSYLDTGRTAFYTDAMGQEVAVTDPRALVQHVSRHYVLNPASSDDGNEAFKKHRSHCGLRGALGLKN